jgi:hypothetical protein
MDTRQSPPTNLPGPESLLYEQETRARIADGQSLGQHLITSLNRAPALLGDHEQVRHALGRSAPHRLYDTAMELGIGVGALCS